jgi:drug/metabolite transporter (DMT)-like permease
MGPVPSAAPPPLGGALQRPPTADLVLLGVGVLAVSVSAPLIAATAAPALAIAFWRNALGTAAIAPFALATRRTELAGLSRREFGLAVLAGLLLALHFGTWIPSLDYTTVAASTALVATQPIWAALIAQATGQRIPRQAWTGIGVALVGVLVLTGIDVSLDPSALVGDALALIGAVFAAAYVSVGSRVRQTVSTTSYTLLCYGVCAAALLVACVVGGQQLGGYGADTWLKLLALTVTAQLLGHSVLNRVLKRTSPTIVSLGILFEMPGATLVAAVWLGQVPPWGILPAAGLILAGLVIVVRSAGRVAPVGAPDGPDPAAAAG